MYSTEYLPHFEKDEQERINNIKDHIKEKDFDYLYLEFEFEDNEDIIDAFFDETDQLHIVYNVSEPEDFMEDPIDCTDGLTRSQEEYNEWISNLMVTYQEEPTDLTEEEKQALIEGGYIDDDFEDEEDNYTDEAKEVYDRIQYELSDDERMYYWFSYCNKPNTDNSTINDFWNWFEGLDSDEIEDFNDFINGIQPIN